MTPEDVRQVNELFHALSRVANDAKIGHVKVAALHMASIAHIESDKDRASFVELAGACFDLALTNRPDFPMESE